MLYQHNKDLVLAPTTLEKPKGESLAVEEHVLLEVGLADKNKRLPTRIRRMVVQREGELHRLDSVDVCRRVLERLKAGSSVQHAVESETQGMSHDQIAICVETLEATIGQLHLGARVPT